MLFSHTWQAVIECRKTQTRRLVRPSEHATPPMNKYIKRIAIPRGQPVGIVRRTRTVYEVGSTYAVQPGRGKPAIIYNPDHPCYGIDIIQPGDDHYQWAKNGTWNYRGQGYQQARIRITGIRREDIRGISDADVKAEGFESRLEFWQTWLSMHDKQFKRLSENQSWWNNEDILHMFLKDRPKDRYQAWALTFVLVNAVSPLPFDGPVQDHDYPSPVPPLTGDLSSSTENTEDGR